MVSKFVWPLLRLAAFTALVRGLFLWLKESHGIDVERWVATLIGAVESVAVEAPSWVGWMLAGGAGLFLMALWEIAKYRGWFLRRGEEHKPAPQSDANQLLISADDIIPAESNGCSAPEFVTLPGSGARSAFVAFDTAAQEHGGWSMDLPPEWEHHKVRFRLRWSHPKVTQGNASGVAFKIFGPVATTRSFAASVKITDFGGAPDTLHLSPWSDPSQPISFDRDNYQVFEIVRDVAAEEDTLLEDARIHAALIERLEKQ